MRIESIRLKNFKSFKDAELSDLPNLCIIVGANGTGKSTVFQVFQFLRDAMAGNVNAALARLGGSRGFQEVRSRDSKGAIEIELKFRARPDSPLPPIFSRSTKSRERRLLNARFSNTVGAAAVNLGIFWIFPREEERPSPMSWIRSLT